MDWQRSLSPLNRMKPIIAKCKLVKKMSGLMMTMMMMLVCGIRTTAINAIMCGAKLSHMPLISIHKQLHCTCDLCTSTSFVHIYFSIFLLI